MKKILNGIVIVLGRIIIVVMAVLSAIPWIPVIIFAVIYQTVRRKK